MNKNNQLSEKIKQVIRDQGFKTMKSFLRSCDLDDTTLRKLLTGNTKKAQYGTARKLIDVSKGALTFQDFGL